MTITSEMIFIVFSANFFQAIFQKKAAAEKPF
jgi:hypothetical protein